MERTIVVVLLGLSSVTRWSVCLSPERELEEELLKNYDYNELPSVTATEVKVGFYFNQIKAPDYSVGMHFSSIFYLRQLWKDPRLQFSPDKLNGKKTFKMSDNSIEKIWKPDIYLRNGFDVNQGKVIHDNMLLTLNSSGFLWFIIRLSASFYCPMKMSSYPFDTQRCEIMIESFGHQMDEYYLSWMDHPAQIDLASHLQTYGLREYVVVDCSQNYTTGAFPCLEIRLLFRRSAYYFYIQVFVPTLLLVIMSWCVLWLDIQHFPHRLGLVFVLMVSFILMYMYVGKHVSKLRQITALDIWMFICLTFISAVLIESLVVTVIYTRRYKTTEHVNLSDPNRKHSHGSRVTHLIDVVSRDALPVVYILTVIIYFGLYLS